jgi:L-lactate dehydrogenase (cytochrome)
VRENEAAFERIRLLPRVGVRVDHPVLATRVLGQNLRFPVLTAPTGNIRPYHPDAEPGVVRAAARAGTAVCISSLTGTSIETITSSANAPVFFQLYYLGDRESSAAVIQRAHRAGCAGLIVTLDTPGRMPRELPVPERTYVPVEVNFRNALRFAPQAVVKPRWLYGFTRDGLPNGVPMGVLPSGQLMQTVDAMEALFARDIPTWTDFAWIRDRWPGLIVAKGILSVADALRAVEEGADAIVVSNHGGMLFDALPPTVGVLESIVEAVGDRVEVILDSGIRRPIDVARAMALGARAVLIGRAYVWAHAAAGEVGVYRMLEIFREGLEMALKFLGCSDINALDRSYLWQPGTP